MRSDPRVDDAARSILDGEAVDWSALEASSDQDTLGLIEQLKLLSEVGRVHRSDTPAVASALPERRTSTTDTRRQLTHWGHLQVMEALGSGSFGDVYLALDTRLEREPLERLVEDGELCAYRHPDFWQCMDTLRDKRYLEGLWSSGKAPWKVWA